MDESPRTDSLARAVKTLAAAVGFLAAGVLALFAIYAFTLFRSRAFFRGTTSVSTSTSRTTRVPGSTGSPVDEKAFNSLPVEEKIRRSTAILLTRNEKAGGMLKAVVSEILKRPDEGLNYSVGDELGELSRPVEGDTDYGEGDVVFLVNSPTEEREALPYRRGRITGLGDMPLEFFRAMARGQKGSAPASPATSPASGAAGISGPPSRGPLIDLERTTNGEGVTRSFSIPKSVAAGIPEWFPEKGEPPLKMTRAIQLATAAASAGSPHAEFVARSIRLQLVSCDEPIGNRWYYVLDCVPRQPGGLGMRESVPVVVLMDGTVVTGTLAH